LMKNGESEVGTDISKIKDTKNGDGEKSAKKSPMWKIIEGL